MDKQEIISYGNLKTSQKAVAQPSVPADLSSWKPLLTPTEVFSLHQLLPQKTAIIVEKVVDDFDVGVLFFPLLGCC